MKAFTFRLESTLRWRETQLNLQKQRSAAAAADLARIAALIQARKSEVSNAAIDLVREPTGTALVSYAGFERRSHDRIRDFQAQAMAAQRALDTETNRLIEANRQLRLLEKLKQQDRDGWHREFDRELSAFADEAFLGRLQSRKRTGA